MEIKENNQYNRYLTISNYTELDLFYTTQQLYFLSFGKFLCFKRSITEMNVCVF